MNSVKRIFFSLKAQLENVADDFENHEAVASAAIKELEAYQGKTRIHQHRLQQMIEQFEATLAELHKDADTWSVRAVKSKALDEQKALECVKRMLQVQQHIKQVEPQLAKAQEQQAQLHKDLTDIQAQLQAMYAQKELLAARQNRMQLHTWRTEQVNPALGAQAVFKRWEQSVVGSELSDLSYSKKDSFADEFAQEENALELRLVLEELANKQTQ